MFLELSLNSDAFTSLKNDFDSILRKTLSNMKEQENDIAEITMKLKITLEHDSVDMGYDKQRPIIKPKFDHKVTSVMQMKDETSGCLNGDYEMVWDEEKKKYILTHIKTRQVSMFDE